MVFSDFAELSVMILEPFSLNPIHLTDNEVMICKPLKIHRVILN